MPQSSRSNWDFSHGILCTDDEVGREREERNAIDSFANTSTHTSMLVHKNIRLESRRGNGTAATFILLSHGKHEGKHTALKVGG